MRHRRGVLPAPDLSADDRLATCGAALAGGGGHRRFRSSAGAGRSARWSASIRHPRSANCRSCRRRPLDILLAALEPGAIALDNALRVQRAEALSVTDDLTQLYNSRYLTQALRQETKRAMRSGWPLSLLFIDLDGFKRSTTRTATCSAAAR